MVTRFIVSILLVSVLAPLVGCYSQPESSNADGTARWLCLVFASPHNTTDAGMFVRFQGKDVDISTVFANGSFFRDAAELRQLRSKLSTQDQLISTNAVDLVRGGRSIFRDAEPRTIAESTHDEDVHDRDAERPAEMRSPKGWKLFRLVGGEDAGAFLAVPMLNRYCRADQLLDRAVYCRGWEEVSRLFPGSSAPFDSVVVTFEGRNDHDVAPGLIEAFDAESVPHTFLR